MNQIIDLGNSGIQLADSGAINLGRMRMGIQMAQPISSKKLVVYNLVIGSDNLVLGTDNLTVEVRE